MNLSRAFEILRQWPEELDQVTEESILRVHALFSKKDGKLHSHIFWRQLIQSIIQTEGQEDLVVEVQVLMDMEQMELPEQVEVVVEQKIGEHKP